MTDIVPVQDYAEHVIKSKQTIRNIEIVANKNDYKTAKILAHQLMVTAMFMYDALEKHEES